MSAHDVKMEDQSTKETNGSNALNKDLNQAKPEDPAEPPAPAKIEESAKAKQRVHWNDEADKALLMSMVILATSNGQEKKAASFTSASGQVKAWNKIELPWQAVADVMAKMHDVQLSKDSANQRYLKHLLPFFKQHAAAFTDPPHADAATDDAANGPAPPKRKRKSKAKEAKAEEAKTEDAKTEEETGEPAPKKAKTAKDAEQDVNMADQ
ncbi:hypothetical protein K449DRAFT_427844 [Hypoxylon sp. EC38]|nr:hypothetical protein K449DRAFT_427844 [Hypoxylon sp. EC38]